MRPQKPFKPTPRTEGLYKPPYADQKGVCYWCGNPLPPRKQHWCSHRCLMAFWSAHGRATNEYVRACVRKQYGKLICENCRKDMTAVEPSTADHKIPLALGGTNDDANLWLLCEACNKQKTKKDMAAITAARHDGRIAEQLKGVPDIMDYASPEIGKEV